MAPEEVFSFLALSALPNEGPILTAWRPGAGVQTELLEPAMVVREQERVRAVLQVWSEAG